MKSKKKIISVVGARPNFMKLAPMERELRRFKKNISHKIVHTGQHYDYKLSQIFFKDLDLPAPDIYLGIGSSSHSDQTARIMQEFEKIVIEEKPDLVIVFGDVNSTLACSIVCSKIHYGKDSTIPIAHVEAGLRSFDNTMPEEINRVVTDNLSKLLFVTEKTGIDNLLKEGISSKKMFLVGDTMIDSLVQHKSKINKSGILKKYNLQKQQYILSTIHRPVNTDKKSNLEKIISIFGKISVTARTFIPGIKIVFPMHPRATKMINSFGLMDRLMKIPNLLIKEPAGYTDFIKLLSESKFVITDSGGIQEEATFLRIPCLTLRDSFERPETLELGTNTLCGLNEKLILSIVKEIFMGIYKKGRVPPLMDGNASKRIIGIINKNL